MGESKTNGDYVALPDKDREEKAAFREVTWKHMLTVSTSMFFLSVPFCGGTVMIQMFTFAGMGSSMCPEFPHHCSQQVLMMSNIFTLAIGATLLFSMPAGVLFDKLGGRMLGVVSSIGITSIWIAIYFLIHFSNAGYDNVAFPLFGVVMVMSGMASVLKMTGVFCLTIFFHEHMGLVVASIVVSSSLEQMQPLAIVGLVIEGYISFSNLCLLHGVLSGMAGFTLYWAMPSPEQCRIQAEKVTGKKQNGSKDSFWKAVRMGAKLMWANMSEHAFTLVMWVCGMTWATPYSNLSCQYAVYLLGNPDEPSDPANGLVTAKMGVITIGSSIVVAVGLFPFAAAADQWSKGRFIPVSIAMMTGLAALVVTIPSWTAQAVVCVSGSYVMVSASMLLNNRCLAFSPANRLGTFRGLFEFCDAIVAVPLAIGIQIVMGSLPDAKHMMGMVFFFTCTFACIALALFAVYHIWFGLPPAPVVLPEDEADLCLCYGCKSIDEVLHVLQLNDVKLLRSMWGSNDPEVQMKLVLHINGQRMAEKMAERDIEELASCMRSEVAWRRELPTVANDMMGIPLNMAMIGANFSRLIDSSRMGQGQAKTVQHFEKEIASGRSKFIVDEKDPSQMKRLVSLVALRLFTNRGPNKKTLWQMSEQFPDGRSRFKPQLPGTKKGPSDTLATCVTNILKKYNMLTFKIHVLDEQVTVTEEQSESPSYPGLITVYRKELVDAYIVEDNDEALSAVGLPAGSAWSVYNEKSQYTYALEWLTEDECAERTASKQASNSPQEQVEAVEARPNAVEQTSVKAPHEIIRSLEARDFSKKLIFLLHMDDVDGLEYWFMNENACNICEAFIDLDAWPDAEPEVMMEKFSKLLSNERIASLLQKRHDLKPVVIHLLRDELIKVQKKNAHMNTDLV